MKKVPRLVGSALLLLVVAGGAFYVWASVASANVMDRSFTAHEEPFPIPYPLSDGEVEEQGLTAPESYALAEAQAVERGRHLVESRYACSDCHGANFGGGTMIDAFPIGTLLGPNITTGAGSRTLEYTAADWDRTVRHGVLPDGRPAIMPSTEFRNMSDQELSDIVTYIRTQPPVDATLQPPTLGPLGKEVGWGLDQAKQATVYKDKQGNVVKIEPNLKAHAKYVDQLKELHGAKGGPGGMQQQININSIIDFFSNI